MVNEISGELAAVEHGHEGSGRVSEPLSITKVKWLTVEFIGDRYGWWWM